MRKWTYDGVRAAGHHGPLGPERQPRLRGLAATGRHKWYTVSWIGLVIAAILHGLNDWSRVNGHWLWIVVTIVSGILFLGYATVGSRSDLEVSDPWPPASGRHGLPPERPPATVGGAPRPWWEH